MRDKVRTFREEVLCPCKSVFCGTTGTRHEPPPGIEPPGHVLDNRSDSHYQKIVAITSKESPGRSRKRRSTMRRVQAVALDLFEQRGFDEVTIEEIATGAEISAPTVYRHFGTKEQIVLWDDYDPLLFAAVSPPEGSQSLLDALVDQIGATVDEVTAIDAKRILRRSRLIRKEPALRAANTATLALMRDGLKAALLESRSCASEFDAQVVAGAICFALEASVAHWEISGGKKTLGVVMRDGLSRLARLTDSHAVTYNSGGGRRRSPSKSHPRHG